MPVNANVSIPITLLRSRELGTGSMALTFTRPIGFTFDAGDWIDLAVEGEELKGGKTYSLSSAPTEGELEIMFRTGISTLKQHLQNLQPGQQLLITQYGNDYGFQLREHRDSVLIAGGIGIAPFRSMLKEMYDTHARGHVQLLYLNKGDKFIVADELNEWKKTLNLTIEYVNTMNLKRKDRLKLFKERLNQSADYFYIAGPEAMVETTEHMLIDEFRVDPSDIRIDSFGGY